MRAFILQPFSLPTTLKQLFQGGGSRGGGSLLDNALQFDVDNPPSTEEYVNQLAEPVLCLSLNERNNGQGTRRTTEAVQQKSQVT